MSAPRVWLDRESVRGAGAIAVLALWGPDAKTLLVALAPGAASLSPGVPKLVRLAADGHLLDEALVIERGSDRFELHLHGGPAVVDGVALALQARGASVAAGGRSIEARALEALAGAPGEWPARVLLDQAEGALRRALDRLVLAPPERWRAGLCELVERGRRFARVLAPPRVVLAGPVNAGKSTLFNTLLGRERALVNDEPGTTRDLLEQTLTVGAFTVRLVDTAGDREPTGPAADTERAGQNLGRVAREAADLVLWLSPADAPAAPPPLPTGTPVLVVHSRADLALWSPQGLCITAQAAPAAARAALGAAIAERLHLFAADWPLGRAVPFHPSDVDNLERLAREPYACDARARSLARITGPRSIAWWD